MTAAPFTCRACGADLIEDPTHPRAYPGDRWFVHPNAYRRQGWVGHTTAGVLPSPELTADLHAQENTAMPKPVHVTAEQITELLDRDTNSPQEVVIDLHPGDTAWNPASTKHDIAQPGHVLYRRHPDGGIDAHLTPLHRARR